MLYVFPSSRTACAIICQVEETVLQSSSEAWRTSEGSAFLMRWVRPATTCKVCLRKCCIFFLKENKKMATDTVAIPEERGLETHGIERVSPKTRTHVRIFDNFTMWLSANLVISTIALGALANLVFGLGFWDGLAAILIFNALGVLPVAIFSTLGPKLGLRQMTISRFSFGWVGGF